jgi:hypothetical protein
MTDHVSYFRVYEVAQIDGYPAEWHRIGALDFGIKHLVRDEAGHRCVRCGHPYWAGEHGSGEWSTCDEHCEHGGPIRVFGEFGYQTAPAILEGPLDFPIADDIRGGFKVEALWRVLTVHHLNGVKLDCRWWNLAALCQRCHLSVQSRVIMDRPWTRPHTPWFRPYVAAYYAHERLGETLTRAETLARLDELLALEDQQLPLETEL